MTLALYGKSKRRQGGLILAGLLAIFIALAGAMLMRGDAKADQTTCLAGTVTGCTDVIKAISLTPPPQQGNYCGAANFSFVIDLSASVSSSELTSMKNGINGFVDAYEALGVGQYRFTTYGTAVIANQGYTTGGSFKTAVTAISQPAGQFTHTQAGILGGNLKNDTSSDPHVMFVLTDGSPNRNNSGGPTAFNDPATWLNSAVAAVNAANTARTNFLVIAIYIGEPDTTMAQAFPAPNTSQQIADFALSVMNGIGGGAHFTTTFSDLANTLLDASDCDKITKTFDGFNANYTEASWTIQVENLWSGSRTYTVEDPNATLYQETCSNNPAGASPWSCQVPANSTATIKATTPLTAGQCRAANTATLKVGTTVVDESSANTTELQPGQGPCPPNDRTINVCKLLVGNNDGVVTAGTFTFEVKYGETTQQVQVTVTEHNPTSNGSLPGGFPGTIPTSPADGIVCQSVTVPATATVEVREVGFPNGWVHHPSVLPNGPTYPSFYNGSWNYAPLQGLVATISTTSNQWVIFKNRGGTPPETRNLQICKVVVGNGDLAIRSGSFNFDVRENGNTVLNGIGGITAGEPNPDTNGTNGTEVCKTVQVATDKTISVAEWGSRPAGWNGDATGYPKYSINGGAQVANNTTSDIAAGTSDVKVTFYNKDSLPTVNVTFSKFICKSLGDIARNQEGQADDDVGKPSMSATGDLSAQLGPVGSIGNDEAVNFSNDGRNAANCHLWGSDLINYPEETGTWGMEVYNTSRNNPLMSVNIPGNGVPGAGSISVPLTQEALLEALAPDSSGARVEEVFKTGYGFGSLKCYTDHLHQDNWEWLDFNPGGIPQGEIHCIAYNVKADKEIKIQKLFIGASFTADDYPAFTLNPVPQGFDIANCTVATSGNVVTWTCKVPYDWNGTITETPKPGWQEIPTLACRDWFADQGQGVLVTEHFFCNQAVGTVVIIKFENVDPSTPQNWTFTGTLPGAPFAAQTTGSSNSTDVVQQTVNNVPVGNYTLSETQGRGICTTGTTSNDWQTHGLVKLDIAQEGPPTAADLNALPPIGTGVLGFSVVKNTVTYVAWGNRGCGTVLSSQQLQVIKYSDPLANFTGNTPLSDWEITITGTAGAATGFVATEDTNGAAGALFLGIPDGTYTVCETPKANWNVVGSRYNAVNQAGSCRTGVVLNLNETVVVNFYNQPRVNITVNKVIFNNANPQGANGGSGWTFTLNGCGVVNDSKTTGASGSVFWNDLPPAVNCTYTVTETAKAGWVADQISYNTSPTAAGSTANLTFVNRQIEGCVNINDCPPPTTPTPTPTTPPGSTPTPTSTPTTPPGETPAASPTPEETVAGEQTPGPGQPTPQAPDTGAGFGVGGSAGFNVLLLIAGLIAISGGMSFIALGRRTTTRR